MSTITDQEKLIEVLKFTPRTYKIRLWGYGGEYVMGTVDRKMYDYFKSRRLDIGEFAWDSDYAETHNIPEDMQPFYPGSWHDCDDMGHCWGVDRGAGTLQVEDENGDVVYEVRLEDINGYGVDDENPDPEWCGGDEVWIDMKDPGTVVFLATSSEKGTFFEGNLELKSPFNPGKISLTYSDFDANEIVTGVSYDTEEIDNWGGDTSGKGSDFGFYVAGSNKQDGKGYEKYRNMDDIEYTMTDWFPKKIKPVREGVYMVKTAGKNSYTYQAKWTGEKWTSNWNDDEIKIKEWQGIAYDPDADAEWDAAAELQKIIDEFEVNVHVTNTDNPVDFPQAGWPFAAQVFEALDKTTETKVSESKTWTIRTHYKKSCEQHEYFYNRELKGAEVKVIDGYRSCEYTFETEDGEFPDIQFTTVPGGDGKKDSIDLNSCFGSNVDNTELVEMFDGGCWGDTEITGIDDEDEVERLTELVSEEGSYALEEDGDWYLSDTEVWVWGPLEVEDEDGNVRIVCADENGNMIDFVEE